MISAEAQEDWDRHRKALGTALDKIGTKVKRIHPTNFKPDANISLKLTMAELRALRTFGLQYHND